MSVDGRDESRGSDGAAGGSTGVPPSQPRLPEQGSPAGKAPGPTVPGQGSPLYGQPTGTAPVSDDVTVPAQWGPTGAGAGAATPPASAPIPSEASGRVPVSDGELIARMRAGDDSAYEDLFWRHSGAVRRYARTCCRDGHTADDLTAEVFARMLQAVRGGAGPEHAVRAYLLTTVRRVAAGWTKSAKREHLVDDFAVFAAQAARGTEGADDDTLDLGADVLAMHEAEQTLAMQAFRSLPERWQAVLWHTEVEDESPSEVATLFGLDANGTRVLASRAREGLKQAYLQAHVSATLASDAECARYADRLGAFARGGLRSRAERGLRKHLDECAKCRLAAGQIKEVASGIPVVVPVAVIGWFGAAGYAKVAALFAGGAASAGAAGAAAATGSTGGAGGGAASEGATGPVKAGIAAGVVVVAAVALAMAMVGKETPPPKPKADPPAVSQPVVPKPQPPAPNPPKAAPVQPEPARPAPRPAPAKPDPEPTPTPTPTPSEPEPGPTPSSPEPTQSSPSPTPTPTPPPAPEVFQWSELEYGVLGDGTKPEMRLGESSWAWQRQDVSIAKRTYAHGVTVRGDSSVIIDLNRSCSVYEARVGVDDMMMGLGAVRFSVFGDGARLWRSPVVRAGEAAVPVRVSLAGRKTVRLVVEPEQSTDSLTLADWAESRLRCD
ncbi:sigma-70 family RNA polymerase sigma factor [Streptomyces sp. NPDC058045]|uniref:sigma-70 family RNA polymerase sigma factor n=1 Tax=Streptomyces sp. NPDC058045 TaxID=3346311 RepID=UPI0036EAFF53